MDGRVEAVGRRERVLLVEDGRLNREIARALLVNAGWDVDVAADGEEALASVKTRPAYDILLMDLEMPVLDGFGSASAIRRLGGERGSVPILALSTGAIRDAASRARTAGMDGHLGKPFDPRSLAKTMRDLMNAPRPHACTQALILDRAIFEGLRKAIKPSRFDRALRLFEAQLVRAMAFVRLRPFEPSCLPSVAHGLVGSAGMIGFVELLAVCRTLQVAHDGSFADARQLIDGVPRLERALDRALGAMAAFVPLAGVPTEDNVSCHPQ